MKHRTSLPMAVFVVAVIISVFVHGWTVMMSFAVQGLSLLMVALAFGSVIGRRLSSADFMPDAVNVAGILAAAWVIFGVALQQKVVFSANSVVVPLACGVVFACAPLLIALAMHSLRQTSQP